MVLYPVRQVEEHGEEGGEAVVDAGRDGHLSEQVEPTGEPAPRAGVVLRQLGRPVVEATGGRIGRGDLRHAEADNGRHDADDDPAPDDVDRAAVGHAEVVERQAARQDRNDGEGHGEVGEPAHSPAELLGIAECVQLRHVGVRGRAVDRSVWNGGHQSPSWLGPHGSPIDVPAVRTTWEQGSTAVSSRSSFPRSADLGMGRSGGRHGRGISVARDASQSVRSARCTRVIGPRGRPEGCSSRVWASPWPTSSTPRRAGPAASGPQTCSVEFAGPRPAADAVKDDRAAADLPRIGRADPGPRATFQRAADGIRVSGRA